jgi:hypothetical protein
MIKQPIVWADWPPKTKAIQSIDTSAPTHYTTRVTSQRAWIFSTTAVRTYNLAQNPSISINLPVANAGRILYFADPEAVRYVLFEGLNVVRKQRLVI